MLYGREAEQAAIDTLLTDAGNGRSGVLVMRGEVGIGKTALLDYAESSTGEARRTVPGWRVLCGAGVEAEAELSYAGLHLLLRPYLDLLDVLPEPQARALRTAFGLATAPDRENVDRFLAGLATLSMLEAVAVDGPALVLIDDAHWLDAASLDALLFAARRVGRERVVLLIAVSDGHSVAAPGLPELVPRPLPPSLASALLPEGMALHVRDRIIEEAQGNPLALRELPAALTPSQRAGEFPDRYAGMSAVPPGVSRVQQAFADRIATLPDRAQLLLTVAAADDTGELAIILAAAKSLGATIEDLEAAERRHLVTYSDGGLVFRHPLARTAALQDATLFRRIAAHQALADALGVAPSDYADRLAWHRAAAATGPDESVATELERSAAQARRRGGYRAAAAVFERAAQLSEDKKAGAHRLIEAARAADRAGQPVRAAALAGQAAERLGDPEALAQIVTVHVSHAYDQGRPDRAHQLRIEAADKIARTSPSEAAFLLFKAMTDAWNAGQLEAMQATARRASGLRLPDSGAAHFLVRATAGLAHLAEDQPGKGIPLLREAMDAARDYGNPLSVAERAAARQWNLLVGVAREAYDHAAAAVREHRAAGAMGLLPQALGNLAQAQILLGLHREARASLQEGMHLARQLTQRHTGEQLTGTLAYLSTLEGRPDAKVDGSDIWTACASALLDLSHGRNNEALRRYEQIDTGPARHHMIVYYSLPDHVEAAVRAGEPGRAAKPLARFETWARATGQPWADAVALCLRALLAPESEAATLFDRALELHQDASRPFARARTHLLYGEWLRRHRRRTDGRVQLRSALEGFERLDARTWAERARAELRATGETPRKDGPAGPGERLERLTPQELEVVRLAATGLSNRDIAARMFLSPRTVGYHLYKAFPKLGIAARSELSRLVDGLIQVEGDR